METRRPQSHDRSPRDHRGEIPTTVFLYRQILYMDRKSRYQFSLRALTYLQIDIRSCSLPTNSLTIIMASLERIHIPLEIFSITTRPFPFPSISYKAYMELPIILYNFASPTSFKFLLFSFVIEIAAVNLDISSTSSQLQLIVILLDIA